MLGSNCRDLKHLWDYDTDHFNKYQLNFRFGLFHPSLLVEKGINEFPLKLITRD